jgi:hypothetical protein
MLATSDRLRASKAGSETRSSVILRPCLRVRRFAAVAQQPLYRSVAKVAWTEERACEAIRRFLQTGSFRRTTWVRRMSSLHFAIAGTSALCVDPLQRPRSMRRALCHLFQLVCVRLRFEEADIFKRGVRSLAESFTSIENDRGDDYVMNHIQPCESSVAGRLLRSRPGVIFCARVRDRLPLHVPRRIEALARKRDDVIDDSAPPHGQGSGTAGRERQG